MRVVNFNNRVNFKTSQDGLVFYDKLTNSTIKQVANPGPSRIAYFGRPLFVLNNRSTFLQSTTQGLVAVTIHNHYTVPITINDVVVVEPNSSVRYTGLYGNGIPKGEHVHTDYDDFMIDADISDIHLGLVEIV